MLCSKHVYVWNESIEMDLILTNIPRNSSFFTVIYSYYKYLTFYLLYLILLLKTACIVVRHILFPLVGMDSSRLAITALSTFSEFVVLLFLTILYRPQVESNIYISSSADDSDYVVMISVILTTYL